MKVARPNGPQTLQKGCATGAGVGVGAGVGTPDSTGAAVGTTSPVHPHVPTARACASAHCSSVNIRELPAACASKHVTRTPPKVASVASKFVICPPSRQMLHLGRRPGGIVGAGSGVGGAVEIGYQIKKER